MRFPRLATMVRLYLDGVDKIRKHTTCKACTHTESCDVAKGYLGEIDISMVALRRRVSQMAEIRDTLNGLVWDHVRADEAINDHNPCSKKDCKKCIELSNKHMATRRALEAQVTKAVSENTK